MLNVLVACKEYSRDESACWRTETEFTHHSYTFTQCLFPYVYTSIPYGYKSIPICLHVHSHTFIRRPFPYVCTTSIPIRLHNVHSCTFTQRHFAYFYTTSIPMLLHVYSRTLTQRPFPYVYTTSTPHTFTSPSHTFTQRTFLTFTRSFLYVYKPIPICLHKVHLNTFAQRPFPYIYTTSIPIRLQVHSHKFTQRPFPYVYMPITIRLHSVLSTLLHNVLSHTFTSLFHTFISPFPYVNTRSIPIPALDTTFSPFTDLSSFNAAVVAQADNTDRIPTERHINPT